MSTPAISSSFLRLAALCVATCAMLLAPAGKARSEPILIAHPSVERESVTLNEARMYLTLRLRSWPDSTPITVFVLPDDSALHGQFARDVLQLFPYQLRRVWDRQLFAGTGQVPVEVDDEEEMLRRVADTPGAIGYAAAIPEDAAVRRLALTR